MKPDPATALGPPILPPKCPNANSPYRNGAWRIALILAAVLSLTVNVATRYCHVTDSSTQTPKAMKSHISDAKRQRLLNNGLHWSAPTATTALFEADGIAIVVLPDTSPVPRFQVEGCLYNRPPPPSC